MVTNQEELSMNGVAPHNAFAKWIGLAAVLAPPSAVDQ